MTLDLLDILFVTHFCFGKPVSWWMWIWGVFASIFSQCEIEKLLKGVKK